LRAKSLEYGPYMVYKYRMDTPLSIVLLLALIGFAIFSAVKTAKRYGREFETDGSAKAVARDKKDATK
jgi:hypothetical protein